MLIVFFLHEEKAMRQIPFSHGGALTGVWEPGECRCWCTLLLPECLCTSPTRGTEATRRPTPPAHTPLAGPTRAPPSPHLTPSRRLRVCRNTERAEVGGGNSPKIGRRYRDWRSRVSVGVSADEFIIARTCPPLSGAAFQGYGWACPACWVSGWRWVALPALSPSNPASAGAAPRDSPWEQADGSPLLLPWSPGGGSGGRFFFSFSRIEKGMAFQNVYSGK